MKKKYNRGKSKSINERGFKEHKKYFSKIVFRTKKMIVTLRNERQLEIFMNKYPDGIVEFK